MRIWLMLVLLALASPAFAGESPQSATLWLRAQVTIDADGRIAALEWDEVGGTGRAVVDHIDPIVRGWEFVPGMVDGVPAATRTRLTVRTLVEAEQGAILVSIDRASTGASRISMPPPIYPEAALKGRVSADVMVEVEIAADGAVTLAGASFEGSRGDAHREKFLRAVEAVVPRWKFQLEEVGGRPIATRMSVPVSFCTMSATWCEQRRRAAASRPVAPGEALALESAVRLTSDPRSGI
ncbi:energy transducer TonB [Luteimonas sp. SJ-92]|uniref:Energy transducer TonB n=1 Tax=Luteimonas salinisoli TaxID=2752307 RepID=A0A853JA66_9GAMM|nr:energy transducer TonB [Luteimonas salinisoli]NZA25644.1 energy transducer TonB [Luteimonas salinisoli]